MSREVRNAGPDGLRGGSNQAASAEMPVLTGVGASAGVAHGPARVILGPSDFQLFRTGDVLVCRTTDPAWTPLFGLASAVVTQTGGMLSHAAIVAREFGIPAVLGVKNVLEVLTNGGLLTVDGSQGTVTIKGAATV